MMVVGGHYSVVRGNDDDEGGQWECGAKKSTFCNVAGICVAQSAGCTRGMVKCLQVV